MDIFSNPAAVEAFKVLVTESLRLVISAGKKLSRKDNKEIDKLAERIHVATMAEIAEYAPMHWAVSRAAGKRAKEPVAPAMKKRSVKRAAVKTRRVVKKTPARKATTKRR